jgi:hypothetical protein
MSNCFMSGKTESTEVHRGRLWSSLEAGYIDTPSTTAMRRHVTPTSRHDAHGSHDRAKDSEAFIYFATAKAGSHTGPIRPDAGTGARDIDTAPQPQSGPTRRHQAAALPIDDARRPPEDPPTEPPRAPTDGQSLPLARRPPSAHAAQPSTHAFSQVGHERPRSPGPFPFPTPTHTKIRATPRAPDIGD